MRLTLISEDRVSMRSNGSQGLQDGHEDLMVPAMLVVTQKPLKLLMNTNKNLHKRQQHLYTQQ